MLISENNIMINTDHYKVSHYKQYPPNTQYIYSYYESRGGDFKETVFFGLQCYIKRYLEGIVVTKEKLEEADRFWEVQFGDRTIFNKAGWQHIIDNHHGKLPLYIGAVKEGSVIPTRNAIMVIHNTDPNCYWLTNWVETILSQIWNTCTVATNGREIKKVLIDYLNETGTPSLANYQMCDFGLRGVSSMETAGLGGMSHLVNFDITDNAAGVIYSNNYYNKLFKNTAIAASEHSTITSWGREHEVDAYRNMLEQYPNGLMACVSDSYDIYEACRKHWGETLKDKILSRNGTTILRLDSGYPPEVVNKCLDILGDKFGYEKNNRGYKTLNTKVRILQGDGIDYDMVNSILIQMKYFNWSSDNIVFGSGGGLLQKFNRDTSKYAIKCSHAIIDGKAIDVYKEPATDSGKTSKRGTLALFKEDGKYITVENPKVYKSEDLIKPFFNNGSILQEQTLDEIRERAAA